MFGDTVSVLFAECRIISFSKRKISVKSGKNAARFTGSVFSMVYLLPKETTILGEDFVGEDIAGSIRDLIPMGRTLFILHRIC